MFFDQGETLVSRLLSMTESQAHSRVVGVRPHDIGKFFACTQV